MRQSLRVQPGVASDTDRQEKRTQSPQNSSRPLVSAENVSPSASLDEQGRGRKRRDSEETNPQDGSQSGFEANQQAAAGANYRTVPISFRHKGAVISRPRGRLPPLNPTSQHRRRSTIDSEDGLLKSEKQDTADLCAVPTFASDRGRSTLASTALKPAESVLEELEAGGEFPSKSPYSAGRVDICSKARSELLSSGRGLEGRQVIVEMATSVPREYPVLDLSEKGMEDEDLVQIGQLLDVYPFAISLDLYGNRLKFSSTCFAATPCSHPALTSLYLSRNPLGPLPPHTTIQRFLMSFTTLLTLELADCGLIDEDLLRIGADLAAIVTLKKLNLSGNLFTDNCQPTIMRILAANKSLEQVDIRRTRVSRHFKRTMRVHSKLLLDEDKRCCERCTLQ